jgi:PAS domain S-box-containing protein
MSIRPQPVLLSWDQPPEPPEPVLPGMHPGWVTALRALALLAGLLALLGGAAGFLAWGWREHPVAQVLAGYGLIQPNAAACLVLGGLAVILLWQRGRAGQIAGRLLGLVVFLTGAATLAEYLLPADFGIDRLLLQGPFTVGPGIFVRPAGNTAVSLLLIGIALLALDSRASWRRQLVNVAALLAMVIAVLALLHYGFALNPFFGLAPYSFMPCPFAITLLLLSVGALCARPEQTLARTLASGGLGGRTLRRLLPLALLAPSVGGWLAWQGVRRGLYGPHGDMVLLALALMVVLSVIVFRTSLWLDRADAARRSAEASLQRNRDQWLLSVRCMSEGMSYHDPEFNVLGANRALRQMLGGGEVEGRKCYEVVHGADRPPEYCPMVRTLENGKSESGEIFEPFLQRHLSVRTDPVTDESGRIISIVHLVTDVTDKKKAEQALRRMAAIVESSDDAITAADLGGNLVSWNKAAETMYGYRAEEAIGQPTAMLAPPETQADLDSIIARINQGERIRNFETERWHRDGRRFEVSITVSPVFDEQGKLVGSSAIARDITERKQAQREIARQGQLAQQARAELDVVLASLGEGLYQVDRSGAIVFLNPTGEAILGYRLDEVRGKNMHDLVHSLRPDGTSVSRADCPLLRVMDDGGQLASVRDHFRTAGGSFIDVEYTSAPLRRGDEIVGAVVSFRDVSERAQAERREREARRQIEAKSAEIAQLNAALEERVRQRTQELEATNHELEAFSYSVSHDLRAPLRSIDGFSHILLEEYSDKLDADGCNFLERVRNASQHMGHLIDALLQLSRVTRSEMRVEPVDLSQLAAEIAETLRPAGGERPVKLDIVPGLKVKGDPRLLHVALQNLLGNAFKFTARTAQPEIEFGSWLQDGETVYFVRDNGAGFEMEYAHKLFGAFQRLHAATEFEGNGIGLATVQRIVRRHGGRIWAKGAPGQGATFYFTLGDAPPAAGRTGQS